MFETPEKINESSKKGDTYFNVADETQLLKSEIIWSLTTYSYEGNTFVLIPQKFDNSYYFTMVMLGSKQECSKYMVKLEVHEQKLSSQDSEVSFNYRGNPCSIDEKKDEFKYFGLTINNRAMERMLRKREDLEFGMSFTFYNK